MKFKDSLCPCRTPLRDCQPPSLSWAKTLPEFLLRFLEIVSSFKRRAVLCRGQAGPVPTEQWRSRLWQVSAGSGYSTLNGRQWTLRKCVQAPEKKVVTVLSTRWHRGSLHSFLTGAQLLRTCQPEQVSEPAPPTDLLLDPCKTDTLAFFLFRFGALSQ